MHRQHFEIERENHRLGKILKDNTFPLIEHVYEHGIRMQNQITGRSANEGSPPNPAFADSLSHGDRPFCRMPMPTGCH
jgi:hypothetical protein